MEVQYLSAPQRSQADEAGGATAKGCVVGQSTGENELPGWELRGKSQRKDAHTRQLCSRPFSVCVRIPQFSQPVH